MNHTFSDASRDDRLDQVIADYLDAVEAGRAPSRDELLSLHPDLADPLRLFLEDYHQLREAVRGGEAADGNQHSDHASPRRRDEKDGPAPPLIGLTTSPSQTLAWGQETNRDAAGVADRTPGEPSQVGPYEILAKIAQGGMGVVYRARHRQLNRIVALKMMLSAELAGVEEVQRFRAEAEAAARLEHEGIVPIYEIGQHQGHDYFSMAYVAGQSLADLLQQGPLASFRAAEYLERIARAVHYAHEQGVIHRDLKPANVLIDQHDLPRVTDFGLAKLTRVDSEITRSGQILGTPAYMSPEQAEGRLTDVGTRSDVYGLGAILFAMLTGRPPFQADNPLDTLWQVSNDEPPDPRILNPQANRDLVTIGMRCLDKDLARRYPSAAELADDLRRLLNGEPIRARAATRWERAARWCRRRPWTAAVLGLSCALALAAAVTIWQNELLRHRTQEIAARNAHAAQGIAATRPQRSNGAFRGKQLLGSVLHRHYANWYQELVATNLSAEDAAYAAAAVALSCQFANRYPLPNPPDTKLQPPVNGTTRTVSLLARYQAALEAIEAVLAGSPDPTNWLVAQVDCLEALADQQLAHKQLGEARRLYQQAAEVLGAASTSSSFDRDSAEAQLARLKLGLTAAGDRAANDQLKQVGEFAMLADSRSAPLSPWSQAPWSQGLIRLPLPSGPNMPPRVAAADDAVGESAAAADDLIAKARQRVRQQGESPLARLALAQALLQAGQLVEAATAFDAAILLANSTAHPDGRAPGGEADANRRSPAAQDHQLAVALSDAAGVFAQHGEFDVAFRFLCHAVSGQASLIDDPAAGAQDLWQLQQSVRLLYRLCQQAVSIDDNTERLLRRIAWPRRPLAGFAVNLTVLSAEASE